MSVKSSLGFWDVFGLVGFVAVLLACASGSSYVEPTSFPPTQVRMGNVAFPPGVTLSHAMEQNFRAYAPTVDSWIAGRGLPREHHPEGPEQYLCGAPVIVTASDGRVAHGRLFVYNFMENSTGPAGKGNYLIEVPDSRLDSISGGRIALTYERYDTTYQGAASENVAWVIFISEEPLACG